MKTAVAPRTRLQHIISTDQFNSLELLNQLFKTTDHIRALDEAQRLQLLPNKLLATIFFEPSTRTRLSFETAMYRLGGQVISAENANTSSSAMKGETIEDTIRTIGMYADAIVLRHPEAGTAARASQASPVPVINAGDGAGEHPTQALLDLYTLVQHLGPLNGKRIALVGDLLYGRTVHSLVKLLALYQGVHIVLISPPELALPASYKHQGAVWEEAETLAAIKEQVDALYVTRIQKERLPSQEAARALKHSYVITEDTLEVLKPDGIIMHPLPRAGEISANIDTDPRAIYFEQIQNGVFIRMTLLYWLLGSQNSPSL